MGAAGNIRGAMLMDMEIDSLAKLEQLTQEEKEELLKQ